LHEQRSNRGWLAVLGVYWLIQAIYLVWPVDLLPDFIPVFGYADDLLGLLAGMGVTAFSLWRPNPSPALPYEPLSRNDLDRW
jgi:uncharacterized membrane protein YkvA (DUF1232 family)